VCAAAVKAARAVGYVGAGTVEFIADASQGLRADRIWFMEMNTRLQVEHPVTEAITGLDLVEWQLRVASGEPLPLRQDQIELDGHAIEARLYAEAPAAGFLPSTGPLARLRLPDQLVRVDAGVEEGGEVTGFYDPMIAKLISHAPTRAEAAARLAAACRAVEVWPVKTNAGFLARCVDHEDFLAAELDTGFIEARLDALLPPSEPSESLVRRAAAARLRAAGADASPWSALKGFRLNAPVQGSVRLDCAGRTFAVPVSEAREAGAAATMLDGRIVVFEAGEAYAFEDPDADAGAEESAGDGAIVAPMPGRVSAAPAKLGARVERGDPVVVLEAMKMEHALTAPFAGVVAELRVEPGDQVPEGALLARLDKAG
jgi:acetyl/propionyl-CoA carboxylase alpha subunit